MKIPNGIDELKTYMLSLARIVSEDSQHATRGLLISHKSSKDS